MKSFHLENITVEEYTSPCDEAVQIEDPIKNVEKYEHARSETYACVSGTEIVNYQPKSLLLVSSIIRCLFHS